VSSHLIHIHHRDGDTHITCAAESRVLDALNQSGLAVRKPCRNGVCGLCRCRLVEGDITYQWRVAHGLWQEDVTAGYILPCIAYPLGDLTLEDIALDLQR